ncbi:MAG: hypothetical protein QM776_18085 [Rhodocyclaceae bacterium]
MRYLICVFACLLAALTAPAGAAPDVFILDAPVNAIDKRNDYTDKLLTQILRKTQAKYGPFRIEYAPEYMQRDRLLAELKRGEVVNITAKATRPDWESSELIPIYIPVDKGITEYRIALIRQGDQERFSKLKSLDELKKIPLGVGNGWLTRQVFQKLDFTLETGSDWEGLYQMLMSKRFDYFPRALSEVFVEYDDRIGKFPDMAIDNSFMLYFPLPKYFFVSPQHPKLAKRVEEGFRMMIKDGSFDKLFLDHHRDLIARASFCTRKIFRMENPLLSDKTPLNVAEYWYDPFSGRKGRASSHASCASGPHAGARAN